MSSFDADNLKVIDDVLQMMYWLRGEGLADVADIATLQRVSALERARLEPALQTLRQRGLVEGAVVDGHEGYRLTKEGAQEGRRRFSDEFEDLIKPGHGQCADPDCECQRTGSIEDCRHRVGRLE